MRKIYHFCCILAILAATSCQDYGNKYYTHELEKIDHRQNRELARREIMALGNEIASYPEHIKMYYTLLANELRDDSVPNRDMNAARQLIEYYEKTDDKEKLIRSYIIAGKIFANCNDGPRALSYYYMAEELMVSQDNPDLQNSLYARMAYLFLHHNMPDQARVYANRFLRNSKQLNDTLGMIQALRYISDSYQHMPDIIQARLYEAYQLARQSHRHDQQEELIVDIASNYCDNENYKMSLKYLRPLIKNTNHRIDALLAKSYYNIGIRDSALFFAQRALENGNSLSKRDAHEILARLAIHQGLRDSAESHFLKYKELNNDLNRITSNETIVQMDAFYHNQKQAEENARLRFDISHKQNVIVIVIACLIVLAILFGTYIQRHRRKQELMTLRIQQLEEYKLSYEKADKEELVHTEQSIRQTDIYQRLAVMEEPEHPTDEDWQSLSDAVSHAYPQFSSRLFSLCSLSPHEHHVCLLLKAGFEPARIASLTLRSKAAVSTVRSRLYEKAFGKKGSAKDWDEVIRTL